MMKVVHRLMETPANAIQTLVQGALDRGAVQKPPELEEVLSLVDKNPPGIMVEIGTAKGGTFYALCQMAKANATVISIDLPGGAYGGGYTEDETKKLKSFTRPKQKTHFLRLDSHLETTKDKLVKILNGRKIDLLFIDGDHSYEGCRMDWEMYSPLVHKGGIIALHDICPHPLISECQVEKVWNEIEDQYKSQRIIDYTNARWGGIGVIWYGERAIPKAGLLLDIGRGKVQRGFTRIDLDLENFPWPLEDDSVHILIGSHIIEHVQPQNVWKFFNELWRIVKPSGQVALSTPYAGNQAWWSDPTHCCGFNERSFFYLDPTFEEFTMYHPRPWKIEKGNPTWKVDGNLEILMYPIK